jgi:hypothetical protein
MNRSEVSELNESFHIIFLFIDNMFGSIWIQLLVETILVWGLIPCNKICFENEFNFHTINKLMLLIFYPNFKHISESTTTFYKKCINSSYYDNTGFGLLFLLKGLEYPDPSYTIFNRRKMLFGHNFLTYKYNVYRQFCHYISFSLPPSYFFFTNLLKQFCHYCTMQ